MSSFHSDTNDNSPRYAPATLEQDQFRFFVFKLMYFVYFGTFGVIFPTLPVFFESNNLFNKYQIGVLCMVPNLTSFIVSPFVSVLIDKYSNLQTEIFIFLLIVSTFIMFTLLYTVSYSASFWAVLLSSITRAPLIPMLDSRTIGLLGDKARYGEIRLYGALSFGLLVLLTGGLIQKTETNNKEDESVNTIGFKYSFYLHVLLSLCSGVIALFFPIFHDERLLPNTQNRQSRQQNGNLQHQIQHEDKASTKEINVDKKNLLPDTSNSNSNSNSNPFSNMISILFKLVISQPEIINFMLIVFFSGFGNGVIDAFLFLRIKELGGSGAVMGIGRFITCVAEIPMFQIAGYLQASMGTYPLLAVTQFAFIVRFLYYATLKSPWWVLLSETLNGVTFAVTWSVCCTYANQISPPGTETTIQSILDSVHFGLGSGTGALIGGMIYDSVGSVKLFIISAALSVVSMVIAIIQCTYSLNREDQSSVVIDPSFQLTGMSEHSLVGGRNGDDDDDGHHHESGAISHSRKVCSSTSDHVEC